MLLSCRTSLNRAVGGQLWRNFSKTIVQQRGAGDSDLSVLFPGAPSSSASSHADYVTTETKTANNVQSSNLGNGLRVISSDSTTRGNSVVSLFVNAGSRFESYKNNGVSHFVERFFYAGTNQRSYLRLVTDLQKTGARLSTQAGREDVVYQFEAVRDAVPEVLELVADGVLQGRLHDWDMPPKIDAVKNDLHVLAESPEVMLNEALHQAAFQYETLGRSLACPPHNLHSIMPDDILEYMNIMFVPSRMTLVGTNIDHGALATMAEALFGSVRDGDAPSAKQGVVDLSPSTYVGGTARLHENRHGNRCHTALAFRGAPQGGKDHHALNVLTALLGQGTAQYVPGFVQKGSRLSKLVQQQNLDRAKAFNIAYSDNGLFGVYLVGSGSAVGTAAGTILQQLRDVSRGSNLSEKELAKAKNVALLQFLSSLEGSIGVNEFNAKVGDQKQYASQIASVSAQDLSRAASQLLSSDPTFVSYGNLDGLPAKIKL